MTNMYSKSVQQWNVFAGCQFDCKYCRLSFQRQAKRQKHNCELCYEYTPHIHEGRLNTKLKKTGTGEFIFIAASGDISFCPGDFFEKILKRIQQEPEKSFLLQTKNPNFFLGRSFPENAMLGITLESNRYFPGLSKAPAPEERATVFAQVSHPRKMVTIEPILDFDEEILVSWIDKIKPQLIWIGYESKGNFDFPQPSIEKFKRLVETLKAKGYNMELKREREA